MNRPRLALLNASYWKEATRKNFRRELDADLAEFEVNEGDLPPGYDYDGFVVTGSAASVYWDEEWIPETEGWIAEAVDRGLPGLGVCYGHQIVASALGGRVEDMGEYELGYTAVERAAETPLFEGIEEVFAFESHSDTVTELPPGAELTAENEHGVQGFQHGDVFTVQFHPEYDTETAAAVAESKDLPEERIQRVLEGVTDENYARACETKRLFENFVAHVEANRTAGAAD
jgi:GMP synthase (glutamine-hydrolysing)